MRRVFMDILVAGTKLEFESREIVIRLPEANGNASGGVRSSIAATENLPKKIGFL